ncbi:MAG: hypothetical protein II800_04005 [Lachnospiraceae bacterium]|nr:hypothetical protein [Lachnospiraceae bacterium]
MVLPAFVILLLLVTLFKKGMQNRYVRGAMSGLTEWQLQELLCLYSLWTSAP